MLWYEPSMTRIPTALLCSLLLWAPHASAQVTIETVTRLVSCPTLDATKCVPFKALLDAGPEALAPVIAALKSEDQPVRNKASRVAGRAELGAAETRAAQVLAALETIPDPIRGEAIGALGRIAHASAVPKLEAVLADATTDPRNRIYAATALGSFDTKLARNPLEAALWDPTPRVQLAAAQNLDRLKDPASVPALTNRALKELTAGFVREACAVALGRTKDPRALAPLVILLGNSRTPVRLAAARALGALGDTAAVPALLTKLRDDAIVSAVADALGALGDKRAGTGLASVASNRELDFDTRKRALWSLGGLGGADVVGTVTELITTDKLELSRAAVEALGRMGHKTAVPSLVATLVAEDAPLRKTAVWALERITGENHGTNQAAWNAWYEANR